MVTLPRNFRAILLTISTSQRELNKSQVLSQDWDKLLVLSTNLPLTAT
jgi:hypothetical protein